MELRYEWLCLAVLLAPCTASRSCEYRLAGELYTGTLNRTRQGRDCQKWSSQSPHEHPFTNQSYFSVSTLDEVSNYCREPSGLHYMLKRPWCYTTDIDTPWEFCDVPEVECFNGGWFNETSCACACDWSRYDGDSCEIVMSEAEPQWPSGSYALPMPSFGCPGGDNWTTGGITLALQEEFTNLAARDTFWRYHYNYMGPYQPGGFVHNVCVRENSTLEETEWMAGSYCIYRVTQACPIGFNSTSIGLSPETDLKRTSYGSVPYVTLTGDSDLELHFCCRRDGHVNTPIVLPYNLPMYLLKEFSTEACQSVEHMRVTEEVFPIRERLVAVTKNQTEAAPTPSRSPDTSIQLCFYQNYDIPACYDPRDHGMAYRGKASVTIGNFSCGTWDDRPGVYFQPTGERKYFFQYIGMEGGAYCRLPDQRERPWCYYDNGDGKTTHWDYCDVKPCPVPDEQVPNVAVGRPARFSSLRHPLQGGSLVVDGMESTCAESSPESSPWLQIDLQSIHLVTSVELVINRLRGTDPILRHVDIHIGMTSEDFRFRGAVLCRHDITLGIGMSAWFDCVQPIRGQYLTIQNTVFFDDHWVSQASVLRLCEVRVFGQATHDGLPLGMTSMEIRSSAFLESSVAQEGVVYSCSVKKYYARLYDQNKEMSKGGWCAALNDSQPYFMVDLGRTRTVHSVVTRGLDSYGRDAPGFYTSLYTVQTSLDGGNWTNYMDGMGQVQNFTGNSDNFTPVRNIFIPPVKARFVQINILGFTGYPCLRFELYGHKTRAEMNCDEIITEPTTIHSPNYSRYYGENRHCVWDLTFPNGSFVVLEFKEIDLQLKETSRLEGDYTVDPGDCEDTIQVQAVTGDGSWVSINNITHGAPLIRVVSPSQRLRLQLVTCFRYSRPSARGFTAEVNTSACAGYGVGHSVCPSVHLCTAPCGNLASVNHPSEYSHQHTCRWHIKLSPGKYVALQILHFDILSKQGDCSGDYLEIEDVDVSGRLSSLGRFCTGVRVPEGVLYSSKNEMYLTFVTDKDTAGKGFLALYTEYLYNVSSAIYSTWKKGRLKCASGWEGFDGSCYRLFLTNKTSWIRAEDQCRTEGGHLVSIRDRTESSFIHFLLTTVWKVNQTKVYFGLNDRRREDHYEWSDGSQLTFTDWFVSTDSTKASQPNGGEQEDCGVIILGNIQSTSYWHDIACANDDVSQFICEKTWTGSVSDGADLCSAPGYVWDNSSVCLPGQFTCRNGDCISALYQCDGLSDCPDGSDEIQCGNDCGPLSFTCDNGDCISISFYCDFKSDCKDGSDEAVCVRRDCNEWEFQCDNGQCIPEEQHCDIQANCQDGSDERDCAFCRPDISFKCYDGRCIPRSAECDGQVDCNGLAHEDESDKCSEENAKRSCGDLRESGYTQNGFYDVIPRGQGASSKVECIFEDMSGRAVNVFHHDVENRSRVKNIEWNYIRKFTYLQTTIEDIRAVVSMSDTCEMFIRYECKGSMLGKDAGAVITYNGTAIPFHSRNGPCDCLLTGNCQEKTGRCMCDRNNKNLWLEDHGLLNDTHVLPLTKVKFGDTGSGSEEAYHTIGPLRCYQDVDLVKASSAFVCRNQKIIRNELRCLHEYDQYGYVVGCRDLSHLEECQLHECPPGWYKCPKAFCIQRKMLCDGRNDCPCGSDESDCANYSCPGMYRCRKSSNCITGSQVCDGKRDCHLGDDERVCHVTCPPSCTCQGHAILCLRAGYSHIPANISRNTRHLQLKHNALSEVIFNTSLTELARLLLSHNNISTLLPGTFESMMNLYHLDLAYNKLVRIEQGTFTGLSKLKHLSLLGNPTLQDIEPKSFVGLSILPELALTGTHLHIIKSNMFEGLGNLTRLYLNSSSIIHIEDAAFEHMERLETLDIHNNAISQYPRDLFMALGSLNWLKSDTYAFCCLAVWVPEEHCLPARDQLSSCEDLMRITPLKISLWLVGAIAVAGNIFVFIYRLKHPERSRVNGLILTNLAVSDFLLGVYLIFIAVVDTRYKGEYFMHAENWKSSAACHFAGFLATVSVEVSMLTLATLTLDRLTNILFPFGQYKLNKCRAKGLLALVWCVAIALAGVPLLPLEYFRGKFYSRTGVCIPLHLTTSTYPGWEYSVTIFMGLNTVIFSFIAIGYWYIYITIKQTSIQKVRSKGQSKTETVAARKMALLVFTNVLCWFPTFIIGCLVLSGVALDADVYAWTVVFVLPVNSAVDPILYTISAFRRLDCSDKAKLVTARLTMSGFDEPFPFYSFTSDTTVKTKMEDDNRCRKEDIVQLNMYRKHIPHITNTFTLSTGASEEKSITWHNNTEITLSHAVQHSSHLAGNSLQNEALGAFSKALGKTLINLHKNCLTLDWQNFKVTFIDIGEESITVRVEGDCFPIAGDKTIRKDRQQYQELVKKVYREKDIVTEFGSNDTSPV